MLSRAIMSELIKDTRSLKTLPMNLSVVILTATSESQFRSKTPKLLHLLAGYPMLNYSLACAYQLTDKPPLIVVPAVVVEMYQTGTDRAAHFIVSTERNDLKQHAETLLSALYTDTEDILILHADQPCVQTESLNKLIIKHKALHAAITCLRNQNTLAHSDSFVPFVIKVDYWIPELVEALIKYSRKGETSDPLSIYTEKHNLNVCIQNPDDVSELMTINTREDYEKAHRLMYNRINQRHMLSGVSILDASSTYIDYQAQIGIDTVIHPNTYIKGATRIGENCHIGPDTYIQESTIGDRCRVFASVLENAMMEHDADIGPFSHLRKGAHVASFAHVGNFGEIKNSILGQGAKMGHFSYLGDTTVGAEANIGAGTITCNYDGKDKHPTTIGESAFIGSGTLMIAPVDIGDGAKTGAGSVVTRNVPPGSLVYGVPAKEHATKEPTKE